MYLPFGGNGAGGGAGSIYLRVELLVCLLSILVNTTKHFPMWFHQFARPPAAHESFLAHVCCVLLFFNFLADEECGVFPSTCCMP